VKVTEKEMSAPLGTKEREMQDEEDWKLLDEMFVEMTAEEIAYWQQHYRDRKRKWQARNGEE
jgi:hypothetical protein